MAKTLKELRAEAREFGIAYEKHTTKEELQELVAEGRANQESAGGIVGKNESLEAQAESLLEDLKAEIESVLNEGDSLPAMMTNGDGDFEKDILIDESRLQDEFVDHSRRYWIYGKKETLAQAAVMAAKYDLEVVEAEVDSEIRKKYTDDGIKYTEKVVSGEILKNERYKRSYTRYLEAKKMADMAKVQQTAFIHRRDMLVQLGYSKRAELGMADINVLREQTRQIVGQEKEVH